MTAKSKVECCLQFSKLFFLAEREDRQCSKIEWFVVALFPTTTTTKRAMLILNSLERQILMFLSTSTNLIGQGPQLSNKYFFFIYLSFIFLFSIVLSFVFIAEFTFWMVILIPLQISSFIIGTLEGKTHLKSSEVDQTMLAVLELQSFVFWLMSKPLTFKSQKIFNLSI